jgi:hypothetical protein
MQPSDDPANWLVGGVPATAPPPNDGSANIVIDAGTAPIEFMPTLSAISSISVPAGWGQMMQLDSGLEITGNTCSVSTINDASINILNAPLVIDSAAMLNCFNLLTETINAQPQPVKIDGQERVLGKAGGNNVEASGPVELTGKLQVQGNGNGPASYTAALGMTIDGGQFTAGGVSAQNNASAVIYTVTMNGGAFSAGDYAQVQVNGTLESNDQNCPAPSMIVNTGTLAGGRVELRGNASMTTQFGLYMGPSVADKITALEFTAEGTEVVTLNGNVYTYATVYLGNALGGSVMSDGDVTINNGKLGVFIGAAATSAMTWTCRTFTAAGNNGVTVDVTTVGNQPANSTTYQLIKTTAGMNSVTGPVTKGKFNGGGFPATWDAVKANNFQELDLTYTKP